MKSLGQYGSLIGAALFALVTVLGWIWHEATFNAEFAGYRDDIAMIRSTVTTISADQVEQGKAIARIEGALGLPPARIGALN